MAFTPIDHDMMRRALELARRGTGYVSRNPLVGCVIVNSAGKIIGEGAHLTYGGPHAEPNAIQDAESHRHSVEGATVYVTLEPHSYHGKTPPCSTLLVSKKIRRCVIATEDINPKVGGRGIRELREAGIEVEVGLLEAEAREQNRFFFHYMKTGRPFVTLKIATSLDGRSALASGESKWITSEASRRRVHELRAEHDAVLVGTRTALADDPSLTVRLVEGHTPWRIVLDARLELPPTLKLFSDAENAKTIVATTGNANRERGTLFSPNVTRLELSNSAERIELRELLSKLGERQITNVLVEAGPTLAASFIQESLFDELILFYGPIILGGDTRPAIGALGVTALGTATRLSLQSIERVPGTDDVMLRFCPANASRPN